jgi:hypothetical protein
MLADALGLNLVLPSDTISPWTHCVSQDFPSSTRSDTRLFDLKRSCARHHSRVLHWTCAFSLVHVMWRSLYWNSESTIRLPQNIVALLGIRVSGPGILVRCVRIV